MFILLFFIFSNFKTIYFSTKSISSIASSVEKKTAEERKNRSNTFNSNKLENCPPSTVSGVHFAFLHLAYFRNYKQIHLKRLPISSQEELTSQSKS